MVIRDVFNEERPKKTASLKAASDQLTSSIADHHLLASPWDRVASVVADGVIVIPLLTLAVSRLQRESLLLRLEQKDTSLLMFQAGILIVILVLAYQTVMTAVWGATLGQYFLKLKVKSVWRNEKPDWMQSFMRSLVWSAQGFVLFVPLLSVFSNSRRRAFHDRVSDTIVVAEKKNKAVESPNATEASLVQGIQAAVLAFTGVMILIAMKGAVTQELRSQLSLQQLEDRNMLCASVGDAQKEWSQQPVARMNVALSLFAAGEIDETCLNTEAEHALWRGSDQEMGYFAKAMLSVNEAEAYEAYKNHLCSGKTRANDTKSAISSQNGADVHVSTRGTESHEASRVNSDGLCQLLEVVQEGRQGVPPLIPGFDFSRVWKIKVALEQQNVNEVLSLTENLPPNSQLAYFFFTARLKSLWLANQREQALANFNAIIGGYDSGKKIEISSWLCVAQSENSCPQSANHFASNSPCGLVLQEVENHRESLESPEPTLAYIRSSLCQKGESTLWRERVTLPEARHYLDALKAFEQEGLRAAKTHFENIFSEAESDNLFLLEAEKRWLEMGKTPEELEPLIERLTKQGHSEPTLRLVTQLVKKLSSMGAIEQAVALGEAMSDNDEKEMKMSSSDAGDRVLRDRTPRSSETKEKSNTRFPASVELDRVLSQLSQKPSHQKKRPGR